MGRVCKKKIQNTYNQKEKSLGALAGDAGDKEKGFIIQSVKTTIL
jgi:hypothetical protein